MHISLRLASAAVVALPTLVAAAPSTIASADGSAQLVVTAPAQVAVGQPIQISLDLVGANGAAGYEASAQFDTRAAEFGGVYFGTDGSPAGSVVTAITTTPAVGASFLALTCAVSGCPGDARAGDGLDTLQHARLRLDPQTAGQLTVTFGPIKVVDQSGSVIDVAVPTTSVQIDVVGQDATASPAPAAPFALASGASASTATPDALDVNDNGTIDYDDVSALMATWTDARRTGGCATAADDVNGDGCLDVADLQLMSGLTNAPRTEGGPRLRIEAAGGPWVVTGTNDQPDTNVGDGRCLTANGDCSLRAAIYESNATPGPDTINFAIGGSAPSGVHTIQLASKLPVIDDSSGGVTINGYSQPGSVPNSDLLASNAQIMVEIHGNGTAGHNGFTITSANNVVQGLAVFDVFNHFELSGTGATGNILIGNFIGTNATATFDANDDNVDGGVGVKITNGSNHNTIGRPGVGDRNVLGGNSGTGVTLHYLGADYNVVQNNIFGLKPSGVGRMQNGWSGIDMQFGASYNYIGGPGTRERNVISGEPYTGVDLSHGEETTGNRVVGNFIGTTLNGNSVRNYTVLTRYGVTFKDGVVENQVYGNVIGGAQLDAIWNKQDYTGRNYVYDNRVGISPTGTALPNLSHGMFLQGHDFQVGPGNIFANNALGAIEVASDVTVRNRITANSYINNGGLAIDLDPAGPTANDAGDADKGPNTLLNYPVVAPANTTTVIGTACAGCRVEIYKAAIDEGNRGEGNKFIGFTAAAANGTFTAYVSGVNVGDNVAGIAISPDGNTSEFSPIAAVTAIGPPPPVVVPPAGTPPGSTPGPISGTPSSFVSIVPTRLLDTRPGSPTGDGQFAGTGIVAGGTTVQLTVAGRAGVPVNATAAVLNVTVTEPTGAGYVTVFPCGSPQPVASNVNYVTGQSVPNAVISRIGDGGAICLFTSNTTQIVVDINGYFPPGSSFESLVPARLLDTRPGLPTADGQFAGAGLVPGGGVVELTVAGRGAVPSNATAVVLNVTVTEPIGAGFVTVFPCGSPQPVASNVNYVAGQSVPNAVLSRVGVGGKVCLFTSNTAHLVADINGYFPPGSTFESLVPARLLDTRPGSPTADGQFAGAGLVGLGETVELSVAGRGEVPADATAVALNVTVTETTGPGFVTVFPCGSSRPLASSLNYVAGQTSANTVIVGVGVEGKVCLFTSAGTHLVTDIDGYFRADV